MAFQKSNLVNNINETVTIIEEGLQVCPLCDSLVKMFYINFNEKLLMCENVECEFPFGCEELKFLQIENNTFPQDEIYSNNRIAQDTASVAGSVVSSAAWADIDRMNKAYDSEDSQCDARSVNKQNELRLKKAQKEKENDQQLIRNVENIKELSLALFNDNGDQKPALINNEKWIKNLQNFQALSGVQLLREEEMETLRKKEPDIGLGELKIDIDPSKESISSIKIEITNKDISLSKC